MSQSRGAGLGGIAFGILAFGALIVANVPGGNYKASDVTKYLAHGHRPAVFVGAYLTLLAAVGLLLLLAQLRASIDGARASSIFWGLAIGAAAAWIAGFMIIASPVFALSFSGGKLSASAFSAPTVYTFAEAGFGVMYGAGGLLLGAALLTFVLARARVAAWVRWSIALAGVAAIAALAWFPFFLVLLWALVLGVWTLATSRQQTRHVAAQPA